jgi:hypothetical protein
VVEHGAYSRQRTWRRGRALHFAREVLEVPGPELVAACLSLLDPVQGERVRDDERVGTAREIDRPEGSGDAEQILECGFEGAPSGPACDDQRSVDVEEEKPKRCQAASPFTFPARGPLAEGSSSKLTR